MTNLSFDMLREYTTTREQEWDKENKMTALFLSNALAGEVGEVCNIIKKFKREALGLRGKRATLQELADELADVIIYADLLAARTGINLGEAIREKFNRSSDELGLSVKIP